MKTLRSLVVLLAVAAIVVPSMGSVVAADAGGRQPAMKATTPAKKATGKADSRAKKAKGDKSLKAGKNAGGRKKAA